MTQSREPDAEHVTAAPEVFGEGERTPADHQSAFSASRADRDRTLDAIHRLELALARAAAGETWLAEVVTDLEALGSVMEEERRELNRPDALLAMITAEHPRRFGPRVRNLQEQYVDLIRQVTSLRDQLAHAADDQAAADDLRQRAGWIIRALHHCRARQTDLVYEALSLDLGHR
jgi:hypothetical protein